MYVLIKLSQIYNFGCHQLLISRMNIVSTNIISYIETINDVIPYNSGKKSYLFTFSINRLLHSESVK